MKNNILLSVIIVTFKSNDIIDDCIKSIIKYNDIGTALEITIVDNSPNDDVMVDRIKKMYFSINVIKTNKNGGYGFGNNIGVDECRGKYFLICNPDVRFVEPIFEKSISILENNDLIGLLGVKQLGGFSFFFRPDKFFPLASFFLKIFNRLNLFLPRVMYLSGAFQFHRKHAFYEAGKFDENIFLFSEETDFAIRLLKTKYKMKFIKDLHYYHPTFERQFNENTFQVASKSLRYVCKKHGIDYQAYLRKKIIDLRIQKLFKKIIRKKYSNLDLQTNLLRTELELYKKSSLI